MSFDQYFRDELSFLKEQGSHYSDLRPHLSSFLNGKHTDPDVERLLEGFAFLTSRLRAKIDDDFPELTHSMINLLWPNFIRPFPSVTIVEFTPLPEIISTKKILAEELKLISDSSKGQPKCYFQTCRSLAVYPIVRTGLSVSNSREASVIKIEFETHGEISLKELNLDDLTLFLGESSYETQYLYLWLHHFLESVHVVISDDEYYSLDIKNVESIGWSSEDGILPYPKNVYEGYRLLHEYLAFPDGFNFIRIKNLHSCLGAVTGKKFTLNLRFNRPLPDDIRVTKEHMKIHCVPAINLFKHDADPIDLDGEQTEYKIFPSNRYPDHYEIFSVDQVVGWDKSQAGKVRGDERVYTPFESFQHEIERVNFRKMLYYRLRTKDSRHTNGFDTYITFVRSDEVSQIGLNETISVALTCTNRDLPMSLGKGDIKANIESNEPEFVSVTNITEPTAPLHPVLDGTLLWTLISNLSLNYLSLLSKDALKTIIRTYDFRALTDRQAEKISKMRIDDGILSIDTKPIDRVFKGMVVRGVQSVLVLDQSAFASEGDLYLFAKVLSRFFSLYASINSFHDLIVINQNNNERYEFKTQIGSQPII